MNKKLTLILILFLVVILILTAVSLNDSSSKNTDDVFVVGFNSEFPPFGYKDDSGDFTGFDIELAKEVCKRNNWTFKAQPIIDWNTKQLELDSGEIDCIWSEFTINGREDDYTWSKPYFNNTKLVIVKSDSNINNLNDLKGKVLEVQQGSSFLKTIENNKALKDTFGKINEVDGYDTAFMDLNTGVCDVIIADSGLARYLIAEKYPYAKILNESISNESYGIAFKKGNTKLRDQVQKTLDDMLKDGTLDKIAQKYSKYGIPEGLIYQ